MINPVHRETREVGPFEGLRVVEIGQFIAVPYCGQLLAQGGADVVKVEPPAGDPTRTNSAPVNGTGRQFLNKNRGKRSIAVDLRDTAARSVVSRLVRRADVVLITGRPGWSATLGLDWPTVRSDSPWLVHAECSGFGPSGELSTLPGLDAVLQAHAGLVHRSAAGPELLAEPIIDYAASLSLAFAIATALYHRERRGAGQHLDVSLLQAALVLRNNSLLHLDAVDGPLEDRIAGGASATSGARAAPILAYYGIFATSDGAIAMAGSSPGLQGRIADLLELPPDPAQRRPATYEQIRALRHQIETRLAADTTDRWVSALRTAGVPCAAVRRPDDALADDQAWDNGYLAHLDDPGFGTGIGLAPPVLLAGSPMRVPGPPPALSAHADEILDELAIDDAERDQLYANGAVVPPTVAGHAPT